MDNFQNQPNTTDEKIKMEENFEIPATSKNPIVHLENLEIKKICGVRCNVCSSEHMLEIHDMRKAGATLESIINTMQEKYGVLFSTSSLSRHFANLLERQLELSAQIINADLVSEATAKSVHTQRTVELLDIAFNTLLARARSNSLVFDIADLERLLKMRYQILTGNDDLDKDILAIFQKATDKYGVNLEQGILFGARKNPTDEV